MRKQEVLYSFEKVIPVSADDFKTKQRLQINYELCSNLPQDVFLIKIQNADHDLDLFETKNIYKVIDPGYFIGCIEQNYQWFLDNKIFKVASFIQFDNHDILYAEITENEPRFHLHYCNDGYLDHFDFWHCLIDKV